MNAWQNYITKFNLKAYNVSKAPFSSLKIYDCYYNYRDLSYCHKNRTQKIKFKKNNDRYEASFEKKNTLNIHTFLYIEIMPEIDINYMVVETSIVDYFKISTSTLILIIIVIIILILMILYIINHFKKCIKLKSKNSSSADLALNKQNENELIS